MLIEIHILQNHAPANLNRDDTGSPKDAIFGGARRARISSQCLKRSVRRSELFRNHFDADLLAERTKTLPTLIGDALTDLGVEDAVLKAVLKRAPEIGAEKGGGASAEEDGSDDVATREGGAEAEVAVTRQLIFLTREEARLIARMLADKCVAMTPAKFVKAKIAELTKDLGGTLPKSVDIAMFGRMTTSAAFEDVVAAVQVAHAVSTHRIETEFDYFTAVDDLTGESGAGMIGDVEFNSATFYKYFSVHWEKLVANLAGDAAVARKAVRALIEAAALTSPTGKQNSFAAHNPPDFIMLETRGRNVPLSYANAFLAPCRARDGASLMAASVDALGSYVGQLDATYAMGGLRGFIATAPYEIPGSTRHASMAALLDWEEGLLP